MEINDARAAAGQPPLDSEDYEPQSETDDQDDHQMYSSEEVPEKLGRQSKPDSSSNNSLRRKKGKNLFAGVDPDEPDTLDNSAREELTKFFERVYKAVEESEEVVDGYFLKIHCRYSRKRSELYLELPDPIDYDDYYKLISNPISMQEIRHRIKSTYYKGIQHFSDDFNLMFRNAQEYNQEGSQVWQDAEVLKSVFKNAIQTATLGMKFNEFDDTKRKRIDEEENSENGIKRVKEHVEDVN